MGRRGSMLSFCTKWEGKARRVARRTENREAVLPSPTGRGLGEGAKHTDLFIILKSHPF